MEKFLKINPSTLIPGTLGKFKVFYGTQSGKPVLFTPEGESLPYEKIQQASKGAPVTWHILSEQKILYKEYIEENIHRILEKKDIEDSVKTSLLEDVSKSIIEKNFTAIIDNQNISAKQKSQIIKNLSVSCLEKNLGKIINRPDIEPKVKTHAFVKIAGPIQESFKTSSVLRQVEPMVVQRLEKFVSTIIDFISQGDSLNLLIETIMHNAGVYEHVLKVVCYFSAFMKFLHMKIETNTLEFMSESDKNEIVKFFSKNPDDDLSLSLSDSQKKRYLLECCKGAFMHDIGKNIIPNEILNKDGPLNDLEYEKVKAHPANALVMLIGIDVPKFALDTISYHHENDDGSGYPLGVSDKDIPFPARVLHIVDVFEALTSDRPYKKAVPVYESLKIMVGKNLLSNNREDRDQGMRHNFDLAILQHFVPFLKDTKLL